MTIVRISRSNNSSTLRVIQSEEVAKFANDPLLSSTRILDGLFYKGAIIVEADADAVFYQRVGRQLTNADDYHVAHAHNKQTVAKVLSPYQSLGIRYAAIVDFDTIRIQTEFKTLIAEFQFTAEQQEQLIQLQAQIVAYIERTPAVELLACVVRELEDELANIANIEANPELRLSRLLGNLKRIRESGSNWKIYKKNGRSALDVANQIAFDELYRLCAERGLFIVPVGELEGWMTDYGVEHTSNKSKWIVTVLEKIPQLITDANNVPCRFLQSVFDYLKK